MKIKHFFLPVLSALVASELLFASNLATSNHDNNVIDGSSNNPVDTIIGKENINRDDIAPLTLLAKKSSTLDINKAISKLDCVKDIKPLSNSNINTWYTLTLKDGKDVIEEIDNVRNANIFDVVDFDYVMKTDGTVVNENLPSLDKVDPYINAINGDKAWQSLKDEGLPSGGSKDIVVAVLDTGVDIQHADLKPNIWKNYQEVPYDGVDNDNNGYVDDINGYNFFSQYDKTNVTDLNGHGTHVAGIIAADNNQIGLTGLAYNVKVMPIVVAGPNGRIDASAVTQGVEYAIRNGADVINMSFGGPTYSLPMLEMLKIANSNAILVAASGNNHKPNEEMEGYPGYFENIYPASLPYVIGVMSCDNNFKESSFSNYDSIKNNDISYDVFAPGENIKSTMPNGQYGTMSGTSMAAPIVSGLAALLRSKYSNREQFSNNFIKAQILSSSSIDPTITHYLYGKPHENVAKVIDCYAALSKKANPNLSISNNNYLDLKSYNPINNEDGILNPNETIRVGFDINNIGGACKNINIKVSSKDRYVTITKPSIHLDSVGVYSVTETNRTYDKDDNLIDFIDYVEFNVLDSCPNNYRISFNAHITCDGNYVFNDDFDIEIDNGIILPTRIKSNYTLLKNTKYIVAQTVVVEKGATLTIEEGAEVQYFTQNFASYFNTDAPYITVVGTLNINGTKENKVIMRPYETYQYYVCGIYSVDGSTINIKNLEAYNIMISCRDDNPEYSSHSVNISDSNFLYEGHGSMGDYLILSDPENTGFWRYHNVNFLADNITNTRVSIPRSSYSKVNICGDAINSSFNSPNVCFQPNKDVKIENNFFTTDVNRHDYFDARKQIINFQSNNHKMDINNNVIKIKQRTLQKLRSEFLIQTDATETNIIDLKNTTFLGVPSDYIPYMIDGFANGNINLTNLNKTNFANVWPMITSIEMLNSNKEMISYIGEEEITFKVKFNKAMDLDSMFRLNFGSVDPFIGFEIPGKFSDETTWIGKYNFTSNVGDGVYYLSNNELYSKDKEQLFNMADTYFFNLDTASAQSKTISAENTTRGILVKWSQDELSDLMGYNIYRKDPDYDGYTKINQTIISKDSSSYLDTNIMYDTTYSYKFTMVTTEFKETEPSDPISITAQNPSELNLVHTPIGRATVGDNIYIDLKLAVYIKKINVNVFYRVKGEKDYKRISGESDNGFGENYTARIYISNEYLSGLEYYIESSDGFVTLYNGTKDNPYTIKVFNKPNKGALGDVNNDGDISVIDASMIQQFIAGKITLTDQEKKRADIDGNGVIDINDINKLMDYIDGNISTLEGK